jgi:nucleotide-binding universal stress UspA family protein
MRNDWILVGVDGGEGGEAAVRYAAREATRLGLRLRLVHVAPELAYTVTVGADRTSSGLSHRQRLLDEAAALAREAGVDADRIVTEVAFGSRADRLLAAAKECRLVVLGDQHRPALGRLLTGSVVAGVASRARVPVLRVPAGAPQARAPRRVVAAVKNAEDWGDLLDGALAVAAEREARLVLLHAWQIPVPYDDLVLFPSDEQEWEQRARESLQGLVAGADVAHRDVPVEISVLRGQPAKVIVDASRDADLILLARRPLVFPLGHLGGTGRAVLRESLCPVEVLPPAGLTDPDGPPIEEHGRLQAARLVP